MPAIATMQFGKYQGLGNDFLVVDLRAVDDAARDAAQDPANVRAVCDRQFGVGGDGVLAILAPTTPSADARMRVLNADGSEAEMCGNGIRCVVKHLYDGGLARARLTIDTGAGPLACAIDAVDGVARTVTVDMGRPRLLRAEIPMTGPADERCVEQLLELPGQPARKLTCVSMGNPHAVTFVGSRDEARKLAETIGPTIEHHPWFPRRTNAEFVHVRNARELDGTAPPFGGAEGRRQAPTLELVVWERGCGITLACGTGACATVVAAILAGHCAANTEVRVELLGGALAITVVADATGELTTVMMRGPAEHVFDGRVELAAIRAR